MAQFVAIVTGSNRGIGLAIVNGIASSFADSDKTLLLFCGSRAGAKVDVETKASNVQVIPVKLDLTSDESVETVLKTVKSHGVEQVDVLINNGGANFVSEFYRNVTGRLSLGRTGSRGLLIRCRKKNIGCQF